jgi:hypothetical protein
VRGNGKAKKKEKAGTIMSLHSNQSRICWGGVSGGMENNKR